MQDTTENPIPTYITITESGMLVELPKWLHLPLPILINAAILAARDNREGLVRQMEHVEQFRELRLYCDFPELYQIIRDWAKDSAEEKKQ